MCKKEKKKKTDRKLQSFAVARDGFFKMNVLNYVNVFVSCRISYEFVFMCQLVVMLSHTSIFIVVAPPQALNYDGILYTSSSLSKLTQNTRSRLEYCRSFI